MIHSSVRRFWALALIVSGLLATLVVGLGVEGPVRLVTLGWFLAICPGMAAVRLLRLDDPTIEFGFALVTSLAVAALAASVPIYMGVTSPVVPLGMLVMLTIVLAMADPVQWEPSGWLARHAPSTRSQQLAWVSVEASARRTLDAALLPTRTSEPPRTSSGSTVGPPSFDVGITVGQAFAARRVARIGGQAMAEQVIPMPGLLASGAERRFREGVVAYVGEDFERAVGPLEESAARDRRHNAQRFLLAMAYLRLGRHADAASVIEQILVEGAELPDRWMKRYLADGPRVSLALTGQITIDVELNTTSAAMILAGLFQQLARPAEAIGVIQQRHLANPDSIALRLRLAEMLFWSGDNDSVFVLTDGVQNVDNLSLALLHLRAKALVRQGLTAPAAELLTVLLRRTANRSEHLLLEMRYDRAIAYETLGQTKKVRADLERICAHDPRYRDVQSRLAKPEVAANLPGWLRRSADSKSRRRNRRS